MLEFNITVKGRSMSDVQDGLRAALESVEYENTSGMNGNDISSYVFTSTGQDDYERLVAAGFEYQAGTWMHLASGIGGLSYTEALKMTDALKRVFPEEQ